MQNKKYFIKTYGCQANKNESERLATYFEQIENMVETKTWQEADLILLNTCSVRKAADDRVFGMLLALNKYFLGEKASKKVARLRRHGATNISADKVIGVSARVKKLPQVVLTGCMSRYEEAKLKERYPILTEVWEPGKIGFSFAPKRKDGEQAFIQVSVGCNSFCTYCVVPYARGRERSRAKEEILQEVRDAVATGFHQVTLLGQNVNSWGLEKVPTAMRKKNMSLPLPVVSENMTAADLLSNESQYEKPDGVPPFVELLREISLIEGIEKIRFMTSNPWDFYDDLIDEIGKNKKIDRYIHLPVQAGSNSVLERMNRGYTREKYLDVVNKLHLADPEIQIGTDIIVGFCGETDEDFAQTLALVKEVGFAVAFVAIYSVRVGTVAAKIYKDDVPFAVKKQRWEILDGLINKDQLASRPKIV